MPRDVKKKVTFNRPYTLKRRFFKKDGSPKDWQDLGRGEFESMEIVRKQVKLLVANYPHQKVEVAFEMDGELRDIDGNVSGEFITFDRK